jgi:xylan 1,4-beta-xylosidase
MLGGGHANGDRNGANLSGAVWLPTESSGALPLADVVDQSVTGAPDINAVATLNGHEVDVLLWNYHDADVSALPAQVHLTVDGLHGTGVLAAEFRVDETHSNAYLAWQRMGSPSHPTPDQTMQLEKAAALEQTVADHRLAVKDGKAGIELTLPRQGVVLVRMREQ